MLLSWGMVAGAVGACSSGGGGDPSDPVVGTYRGVAAANGVTGEVRLELTAATRADALPAWPRFASVASAQSGPTYAATLTLFGVTLRGDLRTGALSVTSADGDTCTGELEADGTITTSCALGGGEPFVFRLLRTATGGRLSTFCGTGVGGEPLAVFTTATGIVVAVVDGAVRPVTLGEDDGGTRSLSFASTAGTYEGIVGSDGVVTPTGGGWVVAACRTPDDDDGGTRDAGPDGDDDDDDDDDDDLADAGPLDGGPGDAGSGDECVGPTLPVETTLTAGPEGPSCGEDGLDCGGVSCCASIEIPGGTYPMGWGTEPEDSDYLDTFVSDGRPERDVTISTFALDRFEVTVGRFRAYVASEDWVPEAGAGANPNLEDSGWDSAWDSLLPDSVSAWNEAFVDCNGAIPGADRSSWSDEPGDREDLPMNCLNWHMAFAFCAWDGGRLPTEAEWEMAAAGGDDDRMFPWGTCPKHETLLPIMRDARRPVAVGSTPGVRARWGQDDMAGSLTEWTLDYYDRSYYGLEGSECTDCAQLRNSTISSDRDKRVARGSWFFINTAEIADFRSRAATRLAVLEDEDNLVSMGVRCARSPAD
ncbi:MAG TPA: formylglycine-generating enzyme family protein [Polyangiaceae bacterium LLY-WYZ-14_1]|nr:formylglycine-generating enzyme family protein [Polyangiaceae bacterium LLY-WYZ-14_1]